MGTEFLTKKLNALNELMFELLCKKCGNDLDCIFEKLMESAIDKTSLGFWIWDVEHGREFYSPKFRESLGFEGEHDFPNVPESWMNAITKAGLDLALSNFEKHVETGGKKQYAQTVIYRKKNGEFITLICHGKVVAWENDRPKIMIGVHL